MNLGTPELLILGLIVVLVFGAGWLPKAARNLGKAKVEFDKTQENLGQATQAINKANRVLKSSPQQLVAGATAKALNPAKPADPEAAPVDAAEPEAADPGPGEAD